MPNPVETVVKEKGLNLREAALWLGVSYFQLYQTIKGFPKKLPSGVAKALKDRGVDVESLSVEYSRWRESVSRQVQAG